MIKYYIAGLFCCLIMVSCSIEPSQNSSLDGFWHLENVDTLSTGGHLNVKQERRFWAFQVNLMQLNGYDEHSALILMRFEKTNKTLRCYAPVNNDRAHDDPSITDVKSLQPFGINQLDETFNIEKLQTNTMILKGKNLCLTFKRF